MSNISKAYEIIRSYQGTNNQIKYWQKLYQGGELILNDFMTDYIIKNEHYIPWTLNRTVNISSDFGNILQKKYDIEFVPQKINISTIIGEFGDSYHCYVQYRRSKNHSLMYVNKKYILDKLDVVDYKNLEIDFDYFDNMPSNGGRKLKEHQKTGAKFLIANKKCILADSMGTGKMQDVDTIIYTSKFPKRMGDLKVGDIVFGSDGKMCNVLEIFPHKNKDLYKIEFSDGSSTNCGLEHLWIVKNKDNSSEWETLSLQEILDKGLTNESNEFVWEIPITKPVEYPTYIHQCPPYRFGNYYSYGKIEDVTPYLFIPREYQTGLLENRLEFLSGLLDGKGILQEDNSITYTTRCKQLALDLIVLVQGLGGLARLIEEDETNEKYVVAIYVNFNPYRYSEYKDKFVCNSHDLHKFITKVEYLKTGDAVCIKVDSPDSSYLTNNYIVTHNTTTSIIGALAGGYKKILVITTASLKSTWKKDLVLYEKEENINIVNSRDWTPGGKFTVINYDIIQNFYEIAETPIYEYEDVKDINGNVIDRLKVPVLIKNKSGKLVQKTQKSRNKEDIKKALSNSPLFLEGFDCVIIDEAQKLSNNKSIRYKTISDFLKRAKPEAIYLCTGTPLTNNPLNFFHILKLIDADVTKDYYYYIKRYCGAKEYNKKDGTTFWTMNEATNLDELRLKVKDIYIRRLASETGEMVEKNIIRRYYDLTDEQVEEYNKLWDEYQNAQEIEKQEENEQYRQLVEGMLIRQYLAKEMTEHTIEMTDDLINQGEKVVIMTNFQEEMDILSKYYGKKCVTYNGKMTAKQKDKAQDEFMNNKKVKVFIGNIEASGVGLSLPISRTLIFNSFSWLSSSNKQAEDRVYRLTQTQDVEIIYQLFNDTWAQQMFDKVLYKEYLSNEIIKSENNK